MKGMRTDPSARRAKNVVLLVIALVALPSLLLTAFGVLAIRNEAAAAKQRLERFYQPLLGPASSRFNALLDETTAASQAPLAALITLAREGTAPPALAEFVAATPFTANYFVVGKSGEILVPSASEAARPLGEAWRQALDTEQSKRGHADACAGYDALGKGAASGTRDGCLAALARGACAQANGGATPGWLEPLLATCPMFAAGVVRTAMALEEAALFPALEFAPVQAHASALIDILRRPANHVEPGLHELIARRAAFALGPFHHREGERLLEAFRFLAARPAVLARVAEMSHRKDGTPEIETVLAAGWLHVLVTYAEGGYFAGFELLPAAIEPELDRVLGKYPTADGVTSRVLVVGGPGADACEEECESHVTAWALLRKSRLAWTLNLWLADTPLSGGGCRAWLYIWALAFIALVLIGGIGYTVRAVVKEARESRLKTDFVSSVSHDLRTPLTSIRMFTETLLLGRTTNPDEQRECLVTIAQETERLTRLTERILDFSRMEAGRKAYSFESVGLTEIVEQALHACKPMLEGAGFVVHVDVAADVGEIVVDRDALIEVLINLMSNAVKYSPSERWLGIEARRDADAVIVTVADHGMGIARGEHKRIFDKFYRVDCRRTSEVDGCGIGLSLVQHIVGAHGGTITVDSTPGHGSRFALRLPMSQTPSA